MVLFQCIFLKFCFLLSQKGMSGHQADRLQTELPLLHKWLWGYLGRGEGVRKPTATMGSIKLGKATDGELGSPSSSSLLMWTFIHFWIYGIQ